MLEDEDRIGIEERSEEHAARVGNGRRRDDLDARDVRVPAFEAVRVLRGELPAAARRHADDERHAHLTARHVPQRRCVVHDLVEGEHAEVDGHHLDDRSHAAERRADSRADEGRLGQRRVADALGSELLEQALADGERAAVAADVLSHQEHARVRGQRLA